MSAAVARLEPPKRSILGSLAERYGMEPKAFEMTIRATVMPSPHSDEEFAACCLVAHEHKLNPITKEIYFMRARGGGIQPIVGVDGWVKKCNEHPAFNGIDFEDAHDSKDALSAIKCIIHRKDREHPIIVTEYLIECKRDTPVWKQMPARMLRHRALIQCARVAFGFAGLMDPDEFEQWQDRYRGEGERIQPSKRPLAIADIPDIQPDAGGLPERQEAKPDLAKAADRKPDIKPDAAYLEDIGSAMALAKDMDTLNEVLVHNETETEDRGLQQAISELYEKHRVRIYDGMDR